MANLYPGIRRMFSFLDSGKIEAAQNAQIRSLDIVNKILNFRDIIPAGREEWNVVKNFILGFDKLDKYERIVLEKYAEPFSYKFMNNYSNILQNYRMRIFKYVAKRQNEYTK